VPAGATESGVDADAFRPSADRFGQTAGTVQWCRRCGHGAIFPRPEPAIVAQAYTDAADPVSLREEPGQVETGHRLLALAEQWADPGRILDVGCWTGSLLVAAAARGWDPVGVEPSAWAAARARERGVPVHVGTLDDVAFAPGSFAAVACCDVLEHLADPAHELARLHDLLAPDGALVLTVPDAGSVLARTMGRRWWSVLPMHFQYFTRGSMATLLERCGFVVRTVATHPKVFTRRYYAERLTALVPAAEPVVRRTGLGGETPAAERLTAPDLRDRMAVVATRS
jgi:SAM-dependent methyltransferase